MMDYCLGLGSGCVSLCVRVCFHAISCNMCADRRLHESSKIIYQLTPYTYVHIGVSHPPHHHAQKNEAVFSEKMLMMLCSW